MRVKHKLLCASSSNRAGRERRAAGAFGCLQSCREKRREKGATVDGVCVVSWLLWERLHLAGLSWPESSPPCDSFHKKHPPQSSVSLADTRQPAYLSDERPSRSLIEKGMEVTTGLEMHSFGRRIFGLRTRAEARREQLLL